MFNQQRVSLFQDNSSKSRSFERFFYGTNVFVTNILESNGTIGCEREYLSTKFVLGVLFWYMKNTLIIILILAVIGIGYVTLKPKQIVAPVVPPSETQLPESTENQNTTTNLTATTPSQTLGMKTYSNIQLGISFQYPSDWKLTEDSAKKQVTITTNDVAATFENGTYPTYSLNFKSTDKSFFAQPIGTKMGTFTYDENKMALLNDNQCESPTPFFNSSLQAVRYGGSLMSDPAYNDFAITTTNGVIIILHAEQGGVITDNLTRDIQKIANSFGLLNGNKIFVAACTKS